MITSQTLAVLPEALSFCFPLHLLRYPRASIRIQQASATMHAL